MNIILLLMFQWFQNSLYFFLAKKVGDFYSLWSVKNTFYIRSWKQEKWQLRYKCMKNSFQSNLLITCNHACYNHQPLSVTKIFWQTNNFFRSRIKNRLFLGGLLLRYPRNILGHDGVTPDDPSAKKNLNIHEFLWIFP